MARRASEFWKPINRNQCRGPGFRIASLGNLISRSLWWLVAYILILSVTGTPVHAFQYIEDSPAVLEAVQLIRGLRERRLFDLVQHYAAEQLKSEQIDRRGRSTIVLELIRTKIVEATLATGDDRTRAWEEALRLATDFLASDPDHPRRLLINVQAALTHLSHGSLIRQEIAAEIAPPTERESALQQFRLASEEFRQIEMEIDRMLPLIRNQTLDADGLSPDQLMNLKNNVRYQLAVVNLAKAEMYDATDSLNKMDAINQVLSRLDEVLQQSNPDQPLWWEAQISRARCFRLMGQHERAAELFEKLPSAELTVELQSAILTEQILGLIARGHEDGQVLLDAVRKFGNPPAELQLAHLQLLMAMAADSAARSQETAKTEWYQQATQLVRDIELQQGRYWGRRAEILLVNAIDPDSDTATNSASDFEILVRQGESAFRKRNFEDAIRAFTKAANHATDSGDADRALTMTVRLAQSLEQQKQYSLAATKLFDVARRFPESANAAAIHLRGCWNWAQSIDDDPARNLEFVEHLQTQISHWPQSESTDQARLWLGNSLQTRSEWESAFNTWLEIPIASPIMSEAIGYLGPGARRWMATGTSSNDRNEIARKITLALSDKLSLIAWKPKTEWLESERRLLLLLIEIGMPVEAIQVTDAQNWIDSALASIPEEDHKWRQRAQAWRVVLLAKQGRNASELADELKQLPNDPMLMEICLDGLKANLAASQLNNIADVIVLICDKATAGLNADNRVNVWQMEKGMAEIELGDIKSGVDRLSELAVANPDSLTIQLQYARGLSRQESDLPAAIRQWRRLATKVKPASEAWLECKYNIALLLKQNRQSDEALRLLKYLKLTADQSTRNDWHTKLDDLLADLERERQ